MNRARPSFLITGLLMACATCRADSIWIEGESPAAHTFPAGAPFAPQTGAQRERLSGGDWLNAAGTAGATPPSARWDVVLDTPGTYRLWARKFWQHGPFRWRLIGEREPSAWQTVTADAALIERTPIRQHVEASWAFAGAADLTPGDYTLEVELLAQPGEDFVAGFDCFWLTTNGAVPRGSTPPGAGPPPADEPGWFIFDPPPGGEPLLNLRSLNEPVAGQHGPLQRAGDAITLADRTPTRFWGVNAPPAVWALPDALQKPLAQDLARRGVNLVRLHGALGDTTDPALPLDAARLERVHRLVANLKPEGIYSHVSWYFPLWLKEGGADDAPFGKLFYDDATQARYFDLMRRVFATPNPHADGLSLAHDPAVGFIELCNEDSLFFWTFKPDNLPDAVRTQWEAQIDGPLLSPWHLTREGLSTLGAADRRRAARQARFYAQLQRGFYARAAAVLRDELGFKGLVVAGNWHTADPSHTDVFERWSYTAGDIIDHHGYFEPTHEGDTAAYRVEPGQSFADRPATRSPGALPLRPVGVAGYPQMISEFGWPQPNRFRGDAGVLSAVLASRQGVDALAWFCLAPGLLDSGVTKFGLGTPVMSGAAPASALMFRRGDVAAGPAAIDARPDGPVGLDREGPASPAALDKLRSADGGVLPPDVPADPLAAYRGPARYDFAHDAVNSVVQPRHAAGPDPTGWDPDAGLFTVVTERSLAAAGFLAQAGPIQLGHATLAARVHHGSVAVVTLDDAPLTTAKRILIQAVTEDHPTGWRTRSGVIESLGTMPWRVRDVDATLTLPWAGPPPQRVVALDGNGAAAPSDESWSLQDGRLVVTLPHDRLYTLIER